ncbi:MAG: hypothetical protein ACLQPD_35725 [Desulfomonilaceae bacterium]
MDSKTSLFDTTIIGAIFVICFATALLVINPRYFTIIIGHYGPIVFGGDNLLAKWVAIGVASNILGAIVQMTAICWLKRPFEKRHAKEIRKCLQDRVLESVNTYSNYKSRDSHVCLKAWQEIKDAHPDSIFAWVHYSDPRKELIEWGRRKLHYAYLAENWMVSIILGSLLGIILGLVATFEDPLLLLTDSTSWCRIGMYSLKDGILVPKDIWKILYGTFCDRCRWEVLYTIIFGLAMWRLCKLKKDNEWYDRGMVAMYIAGRMWQGLENEFLPKSPEKTSLSSATDGAKQTSEEKHDEKER